MLTDPDADAREPVRLATAPDFSIGAIEVHPSSCEVRHGTVLEKLEPRVMQVLVALAQANGRTVSRETLLLRCWEGVTVSDHAITRTLSRLRRLSEIDDGASFRIETTPKVGYRLVRADDAPAAAAPGDTPASAPSSARRRLSGRQWGVAAAIVAAAAVLTFAVGAQQERMPDRWAVLTLRASQADLAPVAQQVSSRVRSALSAAHFAAAARVDEAGLRNENMRAVARRENVGFVLDGAVRRDAQSILIDIEVVDAVYNQIVWSRTYSRSGAEAPFLIEQVAAQATDVLRCALVGARGSGDRLPPEVLTAFVQACDQVQRFDGGREDMLAAGRALTARAPDFSRGWSMLALAAAYASRAGPAQESEGLRRLVEDAANRARALDPRNGEALLARAVARPLLGAWVEREALLEEALRLEPDSAQILLAKAELLAERGRIVEALRATDAAMALEPLSPTVLAVRVPLLSAAGRDREVALTLERLSQIWPQSPSAVFNAFSSRLYRGQHADALRVLDGGNIVVSPLLRRYVAASAAGDARARRDALRALIATAEKGVISAPQVIALAASSGNVDAAFGLAETHFGRAEGTVSEPLASAGRWVLFVRSTEPMRRDPRFAALTERIGLAGHWRASGVWADVCAVTPSACGRR